MTDNTTTQGQGQEATVTDISQAKPRRQNRTSKAAQQAALEAVQANLDAAQEQVLNGPQGEPLTDDERAQLKAHTDQLAADQLAADQASGEAPTPAEVQALVDEDSSKAADIRAAAAQVGIPTRATWKQHQNPVSGWTFLGTSVKAPAEKGTKVAKVEVDPQGLTLFTRGRGYQPIEGGRFGTATKFWALVPADAVLQAAPQPKATSTPRPVAEGRTSAAAQLAAAVSGPNAHQPAPEGYEIRWPKAGADLLKATSTAPEGSSPWLVRCNLHQTTKACTGTKDGDQLATKAGRLTWCSGCQKAAKDQAKA